MAPEDKKMKNESRLLRPVELYTVALPFILLMEKAEKQESMSFVSDCSKLLPYLYLKSLLQESTDDDEAEVPGFVTMEEYIKVQNAVQKCLKQYDIPVFIPEDQEEEGRFILLSELLADIFQEVKNYTANFELLDENDKILLASAAKKGFTDRWGKKILFVQIGLHRILAGEFEKI